MSKEVLDEREFELINIVGAELATNQRDVSRQLNLSLGQANMLIRRLVAKGYIRISQLNKRKVKYLLTPKGMAEKMRKSVKYTLKTINSIGALNRRLREVIGRLIEGGERRFFILGDSDFAHLVSMVIKDVCRQDCVFEFIKEIPLEKVEATFLICEEGVVLVPNLNKEHTIDLIHELAKDALVIEGPLGAS